MSSFLGESSDISSRYFQVDGAGSSQLYNTTLWLHLMKCDESINQTCEALGSFEMIEEVINSVFGLLSALLRECLSLIVDGMR